MTMLANLLLKPRTNHLILEHFYDSYSLKKYFISLITILDLSSVEITTMFGISLRSG